MFAVLYNETTGARDNLILPTVKLVNGCDCSHLYLGDVSRSFVTLVISILVDNKN